jgi:hypothetical protein
VAATLSTLRTRARQRADKVSTQFVTDSEVNGYVNAAAYELYAILATHRKDWFTIAATATISSGNTITLSSALASRMFHLVGVDFQIAGQYMPLREFDFGTRGDVNATQAATGTYRIWYVPEMTALSADGDQLHWSIPAELEELLVVLACIKIKDKEEADTSILQAEAAKLRRDAETIASMRTRPGRVSDYDGERTSYYYGSDADRVYRVIGSTMYVYLANGKT